MVMALACNLKCIKSAQNRQRRAAKCPCVIPTGKVPKRRRKMRRKKTDCDATCFQWKHKSRKEKEQRSGHSWAMMGTLATTSLRTHSRNLPKIQRRASRCPCVIPTGKVTERRKKKRRKKTDSAIHFQWRTSKNIQQRELKISNSMPQCLNLNQNQMQNRKTNDHLCGPKTMNHHHCQKSWKDCQQNKAAVHPYWNQWNPESAQTWCPHHFHSQ